MRLVKKSAQLLTLSLRSFTYKDCWSKTRPVILSRLFLFQFPPLSSYFLLECEVKMFSLNFGQMWWRSIDWKEKERGIELLLPLLLQTLPVNTCAVVMVALTCLYGCDSVQFHSNISLWLDAFSFGKWILVQAHLLTNATVRVPAISINISSSFSKNFFNKVWECAHIINIQSISQQRGWHISMKGSGSERWTERPSSHFSISTLLGNKMADQMETEHLGHWQMLPWGHLAHSRLSTIISLSRAKPVEHKHTVIIPYIYSATCFQYTVRSKSINHSKQSPASWRFM